MRTLLKVLLYKKRQGRYPSVVQVYAAGILLFIAQKRYDANIFKIIKVLDFLKKYRIGGLPASVPKQPPGLTTLIYYLSPWMWGHRCLYSSLLYYIYSPRDLTVNIGLSIRFEKTRLGHCWLTMEGNLIDARDKQNAAYFSVRFTGKGNVSYWLPGAHSDGKVPVAVGRAVGVSRR